MIYLNKGFFKPCIILLSIVILPMIFALIYLTIVDYRSEMLVISLLIIICYTLSFFGIYKYSHSKKEYLTVHDNCLEIKYAIEPGSSHLFISFDSIKTIEYYRITSFKGWMLIVTSYTVPQSVFLTYMQDGKEICKCIGYPMYEEINEICKKIGVSLIVL